MKMRMVATACLLALTATSTFSQEDMPRQTAQSFEKQITKRVRANYLLFLPKGYDPKAA